MLSGAIRDIRTPFPPVIAQSFGVKSIALTLNVQAFLYQFVNKSVKPWIFRLKPNVKGDGWENEVGMGDGLQVRSWSVVGCTLGCAEL